MIYSTEAELELDLFILFVLHYYLIDFCLKKHKQNMWTVNLVHRYISCMCLASLLQLYCPSFILADASNSHHVVPDYLTAIPGRHKGKSKAAETVRHAVSVYTKLSHGSESVLDCGLSVHITPSLCIWCMC